MAEYTLYCFAQSGNAYKPALALELAGADWAPRFVDYFGGETRSPAYRAINVMGEVPVLEHRGTRLSQSGVILDYLAVTLDRFGAADDAGRREILRWLLFDNHKLTSYTGDVPVHAQIGEDPDPAVMAEFRRRAESAWSILGAHLDGRRYVVGDRPDDRRHLDVRVSLLRRRDWSRLERVSFDPRLAWPDSWRAALETSVQTDAGAPSAGRRLKARQ
jgi:glutathione S-transferase